MRAINKFVRSLILFSAMIWVTGFVLFSTVLEDYFLPVFYFMAFYFLLLTLTGRIIIHKSDMKKTADFNARYFMVRWGKVMLHLIFLVAYLLQDRDNIFPFVIVFLTGYFLYSIFDIYTLNYYLKKSNQN
jgi:uncharacterized membrane protein YfcA